MPSADTWERWSNATRPTTVNRRPSFAFGTADTMGRQIGNAINNGWRPATRDIQDEDRHYRYGMPTFGTTAPTFTVPATGPVALPPVPNYVPGLPALTAEEEVYFNQLASDSASTLERARKQSREDLGNLGIWVTKQNNSLQRDGYQAGTTLRNELSERGLGFSPMFLNRGMRQIAGQVATALNNVSAQKAARETAMARMIEDATNAHRQTLARIEAEKAMRRSQTGRGLIGGV